MCACAGRSMSESMSSSSSSESSSLSSECRSCITDCSGPRTVCVWIKQGNKQAGMIGIRSTQTQRKKTGIKQWVMLCGGKMVGSCGGARVCRKQGVRNHCLTQRRLRTLQHQIPLKLHICCHQKMSPNGSSVFNNANHICINVASIWISSEKAKGASHI